MISCSGRFGHIVKKYQNRGKYFCKFKIEIRKLFMGIFLSLSLSRRRRNCEPSNIQLPSFPEVALLSQNSIFSPCFCPHSTPPRVASASPRDLFAAKQIFVVAVLFPVRGRSASGQKRSAGGKTSASLSPLRTTTDYQKLPTSQLQASEPYFYYNKCRNERRLSFKEI